MIAILQGIIIGLVTAAVWALIIWGYTWIRHMRFLAALPKLFALRSIQPHEKGVAIGLVNRSDVLMTIREVRIYESRNDDTMGFCQILPYVGRTWIVINKRLEENVMFGVPDTPDNAFVQQTGFILLPPETEGLWLFAFEDNDIPEIDRLRVVVSYQTVLGKYKVTTVEASQPIINMVNKEIRVARRFAHTEETDNKA